MNKYIKQLGFPSTRKIVGISCLTINMISFIMICICLHSLIERMRTLEKTKLSERFSDAMVFGCIFNVAAFIVLIYIVDRIPSFLYDTIPSLLDFFKK